jgi:hypothetical protein
MLIPSITVTGGFNLLLGDPCDDGLGEGLAGGTFGGTQVFAGQA